MTYDTSNYDPSNMEQLNRIEPSYLASYGLTEAPFSLQQDDRFSTPVPNLQNASNYSNTILSTATCYLSLQEKEASGNPVLSNALSILHQTNGKYVKFNLIP